MAKCPKCHGTGYMDVPLFSSISKKPCDCDLNTRKFKKWILNTGCIVSTDPGDRGFQFQCDLGHWHQRKEFMESREVEND